MMTQHYHEGVQTNYSLHLFFIFLLLCSHYVADLIKKLKLRLMVVLVLRSNWCAQNRYTYVANTLYQPLYTHTLKKCST